VSVTTQKRMDTRGIPQPLGTVVTRLNELNCGTELHPPVGVLTGDTFPIESINILNGGQQRRGISLHQNENENRSEVVSCRSSRVPRRQFQQVHDDLTGPRHAEQLVPRGLK